MCIIKHKPYNNTIPLYWAPFPFVLHLSSIFLFFRRVNFVGKLYVFVLWPTHKVFTFSFKTNQIKILLFASVFGRFSPTTLNEVRPKESFVFRSDDFIHWMLRFIDLATVKSLRKSMLRRHNLSHCSCALIDACLQWTHFLSHCTSFLCPLVLFIFM